EVLASRMVAPLPSVIAPVVVSKMTVVVSVTGDRPAKATSFADTGCVGTSDWQRAAPPASVQPNGQAVVAGTPPSAPQTTSVSPAHCDVLGVHVVRSGAPAAMSAATSGIARSSACEVSDDEQPT